MRLAGTTALVAGSAVAGTATYAYQVAGVRVLGVAEYAPVSVLWTVQYLVFAVMLFPLEAFVASGSAASRRRAWWWVGSLAVATVAVLWMTQETLLDRRWELVVLGAVIVLSYGHFTILRGLLAGAGRLRDYAALTAGEALVRLVLTVPVLALVPSGVALAMLLPVGPPLAYLLLRLAGGDGLPAGVGQSRRDSAGSALTVGAAGNVGAQGLLAAGPLLVPALGGSPADVTVAFVLLTAARVPVFLALGGIVSRELPELLRLRATCDAVGLVRHVRRAALVGLAAAATAAFAGYVLAPAALAFVFGEAARPLRLTAAAVFAAVVLVAAALIMNQALVIIGSSIRLVASWLFSLAVSGVLLALASGGAVERLSWGLVAGQVAGVLLLLASTTVRSTSLLLVPLHPVDGASGSR